eukprot:scpid9788/ scgid16578/ Laminin subunit gamma-1; Laminin B2 chain; Laminin-1 subunit gamma; Laminin-10 subunit gamma; Laminin-11 subunit gamma; Laminin-2 subunit gamma; Laminin-3 subunit gamma; Laminin-4 subunit gamma; Laminin-6 subunit gamma; Laminin-7 subunit gamma; Laminin-8 subunit gamma; Laminin-9 subunit gamma; S-laminin subunit gamma
MLLFATLLVLGAARWSEAACTETQANCIASASNLARGASGASASATCGVGQHGGEVYGFGGWTTSSSISYRDLVCNGTVATHGQQAHPAVQLHDGSTSTWWQSPYAITTVSIQLDWANKVLFQRTTLTFRNIPPGAMRLEYSTDGGATWTPYQYWALSCTNSFGLARTSTTSAPADSSAICTDEGLLILTSQEDSLQVTFNPTSRLGSSRFSDRSLVERYLAITNLRVTFSGFNFLQNSLVPPSQHASFDRSSTNAHRFYYGVYEWEVSATCHCFGHSDTCVMQPGDIAGFPTGCGNCSHNTMGVNCQTCQPLYNNRTWAPGTDQTANECIRCECNGHGDLCHLPSSFLGPICQCTPSHHVTGLHCERCQDGYYRDPALPYSHPDSCIPCQCNTSYTDGGSGICDIVSGQCPCRPGVEGRQCDQCQNGYHSLTAGSGCVLCQCDADGTIAGQTCFPNNGSCPCKSNVVGNNCDKCKPGFYGPSVLAPLGGCYQCLCSNKTSDCSTASGYKLAVVQNDFEHRNLSGWTFRTSNQQLPDVDATQTRELVTLPGGNVTFVQGMLQPVQHFDREGVLVAPQSIVSNLPNSIGHRFSFGLRTTPGTMTSSLITTRPGGDVVIRSSSPRVSSIVAVLDNAPVYDVPAQHTLLLYPGQWRVGDITGPLATMVDIVSVLNHATELTIRTVYYSNVATLGTHTLLYNVSLEAAALSSDAALPDARNIEQCTCPVGYAPLDCSQCSSPAYTRNYQLRNISTAVSVVDQFDVCTACACHAHSQSCDMLTGVCVGCGGNTQGDHCEMCKDSFHGDARTSNCQDCNCNLTGSASSVCNKDTGMCSCKSNVFGQICDQCRNGTYDFHSGSGCTSCGCNVIGSEQCAGGDCNCQQTGVDMGACFCKERVTGSKCTSCLFGTQGTVPNCQVCHPCFDAWLVIVEAIRTQLSEVHNQTITTTQMAFGSMTAADVSSMLSQVQAQLDQIHNLLRNRREVQLESILAEVDAYTVQLTSTLSAFASRISRNEAQLNASIISLADQKTFNGSVVVPDGTLASAKTIEAFTRHQELLLQEINANFSTEADRLVNIVQAILALSEHINASRDLASIGEVTAHSTSLTNARVAADHAVFEALTMDNAEMISRLDQDIAILEEDIRNATSLVTTANSIASAANMTAHAARQQATAQLQLAQSLAADTHKLALSVNSTSANANNASDIITAFLSTAMATASTAQDTLKSTESINSDLTAALNHLSEAEVSASSALVISLPSVELALNLSSEINSTIIPQSAVDQTLADARLSLQEAESILQVAQAAFNASQQAYAMLSGIEAALQQHTAQHSSASRSLSDARVIIMQTNSSLAIALDRAMELSGILTQGLSDVIEIEDSLVLVAECQDNVTQTDASSLATSRSSCANLTGTVNETITSAEGTVSDITNNSSLQLGAARTAQSDATTATGLASAVSTEVADMESIEELKSLLSRYTILSDAVDAAQTEANKQEDQLRSVISDLTSVSSSCPGGSL